MTKDDPNRVVPTILVVLGLLLAVGGAMTASTYVGIDGTDFNWSTEIKQKSAGVVGLIGICMFGYGAWGMTKKA